LLNERQQLPLSVGHEVIETIGAQQRGVD
jgi:hypothetical protein